MIQKLWGDENIYRTLLDNLPQSIFLKDGNSVYLSCNENYARALKIKAEEIVGKTDYEFYPTELAEKYRADDKRIMESGKVEEIEEKYIQEGKEFTVQTVKTPIKDEQGNVIGILGVFWDITERKRAEEQNKKSREVLQQMIDAMPFGVAVIGKDKRIKRVNTAVCQLTGYSKDELVGQLCHKTLCPADENNCPILDQKQIVDHSERRLLTKDKKVVPILKSVIQIRLGDEDALLESFVDITESKEAQEEIEKILMWQQGVNQLQQSLLAPSPLENKLKTVTDSVVRLFEADFCRIWLIRPGDMCEGCVHAEVKEGPHICRYREKCLHLLASSGRYTHIDGKTHRRVPFGCYKIGRVASGENHKFLTNDVQNDSRVHNHEWARELGLVSFAGYQLRVPGGDILGVLALFAKHPIVPAEDAMLDGIGSSVSFVIQQAIADKTLKQSKINLEQANEQLAQVVGKLEEANQEMKNFVYIASHDMREPLRKITAFGAILRQSLKDKLSSDDAENLHFMIDGAERMAKMIEGLLTYSRISAQAQPYQAVDLNEIVKQLQQLELSVLLEEKHATIEIPQPLPCVEVDPVQIRQLMQNLIANGVKYQKKGNAPHITITTKPAADGMVRIEVTDNGIGIAPQYLQSIFTMFRRLHSRDEYEGTGIGLTVCKKIVELHGGEISVESQTDKGSTFWFTMPAAEKLIIAATEVESHV